MDAKLSLVIKVISGEETAVEAAKRAGVSVQAVSNWKRRFMEGARLGLEGEPVLRDAAREEALSDENRALKRALGELYMETRRLKARWRDRVISSDDREAA
ncbi:helix-turn-helix domain-containing protein [Streptomyces sp. NRRL B-1347]|uniref:helix-turn-helix domain-containing protein n=1 Tax=Streptomyces sp. NRRL B-1347 TaxID=1476877 RepID=UPI00131EC3B8|nr:transposase [Streptomyces sp. NRRL B-1347]